MLFSKINLPVKTVLWSGLFLLSATAIIAQGQFTLEDVFTEKKFEPKKLNSLYFIDGDRYITQKDDLESETSIILINSLTESESIKIFDSKILKQKFELKQAKIDRFQYVEDSIYLVGLNQEVIYRHSVREEIFYVDLKENIFRKVADGEKIRIPTLSPNRKYLAYVKNNNIFILNLQNRKTKQITKDGKLNSIINGVTDWVYEEEFGLVRALFWSPDSKKLAYLKFDESKVKDYTITTYQNNYPKETQYKYPRAGEAVSKVSVSVRDLSKSKSVKIPISAEYIPRVIWKDAHTLAVMTLNRFQNDLQVWMYPLKSRSGELWYREESKQYVEVPQMFRTLYNGKLAISSEKSGFNHLYFIDEKGRKEQITQGDFEVKDVLRIDLEDSTVIFSSPLPTPERQSVMLWDMKEKKLSYLSDTTGIATAEIIGENEWLEKFSSQKVRSRISVKSLKDYTNKILLEDVRKEDTVLGRKEFFMLPIKGYELCAWKILPPDFDSAQRYPVLFYVYGGPGIQTVREDWGNDLQHWLNYMAHQGFIVISVDNRGTGGRGANFKKMTYAKLGQLEAEDQLEAVKYISKLPYVNEEKMSMFGWSYGGYLTLMCMMGEDSLLHSGISVAPVTDWRYYDAVYTERYMRTPVSNPPGYDKGSPVVLAENLKGRLLLIHGTADDNVHYQNTLELSKSLVQNHKKFQMHSYTNGRHGIGNGQTLLHLFRSATDFLMQMAQD